MAGIPELMEVILSLTSNVERLQEDVKKLDNRYEKLHEVVTQLRIELGKTHSETKLIAMKEAQVLVFAAQGDLAERLGKLDERVKGSDQAFALEESERESLPPPKKKASTRKPSKRGGAQ